MYFIEVNYIRYLEYFANLWLSLTCTLNMPNKNLVINNLTIHWGTPWEWGHPQNDTLRSQTSHVLKMPPPLIIYPFCKLYYISRTLLQVLVVSNMDVKHVKHTCVDKKNSSIHITKSWEQVPSRNGILRYTPFSDSAKGLQRQLDGLRRFCASNKVIVNESKTKSMCFGADDKVEINFNGKPIE